MAMKSSKTVDERFEDVWNAIDVSRENRRALKRHIGGGISVFFGLVLFVVGMVHIMHYIGVSSCEPGEVDGASFLLDGVKYRECVTPGRIENSIVIDLKGGRHILVNDLPDEVRVISWEHHPVKGFYLPFVDAVAGAFLLLFGVKRWCGEW